MVNTINILFPFLWSIGLVFICTNLILYSVEKLNGNNFEKIYIFLSFITVIWSLLIGIVLIFFKENILPQSEFLYESFCWGLLLLVIIYLRKNIKKNLINIKLSNIEKFILILSILFGIVCTVILIISNKYYIFPSDNYGHIGNFYFNADIDRGINSAIGLDMPSIIHPTYRFVLYPIVTPVFVVFRVLSKFNVNIITYKEIILGYYLCFIQIILNSISCLLFYKIINKLKINKKISLIGTMMFIFSFSTVWLSILPETYGITLLLLLLSVYLFQRKYKFAYTTSFLAVSNNPMGLVTIISFILFDIYRNKANIIRLIKKYLFKFKLITFATSILGVCISVIISLKFIQYILRWTSFSNNIIRNIIESFDYIIMPWFIGPAFKNINPYFVQVKESNNILKLFILILIIICILGMIKGRRNEVILSASTTIISGWILHGVIGYGRYNGIIYSPLYSWAAILLVIYYIDILFANVKIKLLLLSVIANIVMISNILWIKNISNELKQIKFNNGKEITPIEVYIKNNGSYDKYIVSNNIIIRYVDQNIVVEGLDGYRIDKNNGSISGLTTNSSWFSIYSENDKAYINIQGEMIDSDLDYLKGKSEFFIFGMGLRNKYIFTQNNGSWKLIDYYNDKIIFENITCKIIDSSNYKVIGYFENGEEFEIYENEKGIFLRTKEELITIDDSIEINIPNFEGEKYQRELKILFNEVMINITKDGPMPNFIAYNEPWYRDAAIMAMVLEVTNNTNQIESWINKIDKIYDEQNGNKEPDNLGQLLYLFSLVENKNDKLIKEILNEAKNLKGESSYINGITDGANHPVYQTRWLIYGLKALGLDYSEYEVPDIKDSYASLMWFDNMGYIGCDINEVDNDDRWPYLYYARLNFYDKNIDFKDENYPISSELEPAKANFNKLEVINNKLKENKLVVPHAWSAAEMFFYLLNLD